MAEPTQANAKAMKFEDYTKNHAMFRHLLDIQDFVLSADIPPVPGPLDDHVADLVISGLYDEVRRVIKAANFFHDYELSTVREPDRAGVTFDDDRYNFEVLWRNGRLLIRRRGSRLKNFHQWYMALMPSAGGIFTSAVAILGNALGRKMELLRAGFQFKFLLYDMTPDTLDAAPVRNSEIMQRLVRGYPNARGVVTEAEALPDNMSMGRVDWAVSQWLGGEDQRRNVWYQVEAPGNLEWSSLWLTFQYRAESYTSPTDGTREDFDPDAFLREYEEAYIWFLRDRAILGFLASLLRGYSFKTTPGVLP